MLTFELISIDCNKAGKISELKEAWIETMLDIIPKAFITSHDCDGDDDLDPIL